MRFATRRTDYIAHCERCAKDHLFAWRFRTLDSLLVVHPHLWRLLPRPSTCWSRACGANSFPVSIYSPFVRSAQIIRTIDLPQDFRPIDKLRDWRCRFRGSHAERPVHGRADGRDYPGGESRAGIFGGEAAWRERADDLHLRKWFGSFEANDVRPCGSSRWRILG
jgi:hypothetical protein